MNRDKDKLRQGIRQWKTPCLLGFLRQIHIKKLVLNELFYKNGRGGGIRTRDPLHPMQVRYQAALRPDSRTVILHDFF